jgi:HAE1 family hydrophobic/amphiphilic exporter-1
MHRPISRGGTHRTVTAEVTAQANAIEVTKQFEKLFTAEKIGAGVTMKLGGASEDVSESFTELFVALIAGAALMLSILILEFNSFRQSFYLLAIVPLSLVGVFGGLALVGQPLSLPSMLGVIALAGVIINHAIILMDSIAHPPRTPSYHSSHRRASGTRHPSSHHRRDRGGHVASRLPSGGPLACAIMFGRLLLLTRLIPRKYAAD